MSAPPPDAAMTDADASAIRRTLSCLTSVIRCGESWSDTLSDEKMAAEIGVNNLLATVTRLRAALADAEADTGTMPLHEQAFYMGAAWGHRYAVDRGSPLSGADICDEYRRCFPALATSTETGA